MNSVSGRRSSIDLPSDRAGLEQIREEFHKASAEGKLEPEDMKNLKYVLDDPAEETLTQGNDGQLLTRDKDHVPSHSRQPVVCDKQRLTLQVICDGAESLEVAKIPRRDAIGARRTAHP